jgi:hypothetical protein
LVPRWCRTYTTCFWFMMATCGGNSNIRVRPPHSVHWCIHQLSFAHSNDNVEARTSDACVHVWRTRICKHWLNRTRRGLTWMPLQSITVFRSFNFTESCVLARLIYVQWQRWEKNVKRVCMVGRGQYLRPLGIEHVAPLWRATTRARVLSSVPRGGLPARGPTRLSGRARRVGSNTGGARNHTFACRLLT